jgi:hypothetical protein
MMRTRRLRFLLHALAGLVVSLPAAAAPLTFTVAMSEPVVVDLAGGTPRIMIDIGGAARPATYVSGSGTDRLVFAYEIEAGDFDANGISLSGAIDPAGGVIRDLAGNALAGPGFAAPDLSGVRVETYSAAFAADIDRKEDGAAFASFVIAKAPQGAAYSYEITSSAGEGAVTGAGTISSASELVGEVDVSGLAQGDLTLSVVIATPAGGTGRTRTDSRRVEFSGLLDQVKESAAAYSVRRLSSAYAGPLLRVRRAEDDRELDIGATVRGDLDQTSLERFCRESACFVASWYDQSGNRMDAVQHDPKQQLLIHWKGELQMRRKKPALVSQTQDSGLLVSSIRIDAGQARTVSAVFGLDEVTNNAELFGSTTGEMVDFGNFRASDRVRFGNRDDNLYSEERSWPGLFEADRGLFVFDGKRTSAYRDGELVVSEASDAFAWGGSGLYLIRSEHTERGMIGAVQEFIYFPVELSDDERREIDKSQSAYF